MWSNSLTYTVWPAPSCQDSRAVGRVQPRTLDPGTVTCKRDTDCNSFASFVSVSTPTHPSNHHCVRGCGVFCFVSGFSLVSVFWPRWVAAEAGEGPTQAPVPCIYQGTLRGLQEHQAPLWPQHGETCSSSPHPRIIKKGTLARPSSALFCFPFNPKVLLYRCLLPGHKC